MPTEKRTLVHTVILLCFPALLVTGAGHAAAQAPALLPLTSTTRECSADYHIAKEEGRNPSETDDKKRETVGSGEVIDLEWRGKPALIGKGKDIDWVIEDDPYGLGDVEANDDGYTATLTISSELFGDDMKKNYVTVQAYNRVLQTLSEPKKFQVVYPTHLTGRHRKKEGGGRGMIADRTIEEYASLPRDGAADKTIPGASAQLELTIQPTYVSFIKIRLKEKDGDEDAQGNKPKDKYPPLGGPHYPNTGWATIKQGNRIIDVICGVKSMKEVREKLTEKDGQSWDWLCLFKIQTQENRDVHELQPVNQTFLVKWTDFLTKQHVLVRISKFGCTVERGTSDGKHLFTPKN